MPRRRSRSLDRASFRHYVLICWRDGHSRAGWRFTLVEARTEARWTFRELTALTDFLDAQLDSLSESFDA